MSDEKRIVVEVFRDESGRYEARPLGGFKLGHLDDLLCWSDSPCFTPGQALARFGEAIDADLVRDSWDGRDDLRLAVLDPKQLGFGIAPSKKQEPEPTPGEIRDRVCNAMAQLDYPGSVRLRVESGKILEMRNGVGCVPHAWVPLSAFDTIPINVLALEEALRKRNVFHVEVHERLYFFWTGIDPLTLKELRP